MFIKELTPLYDKYNQVLKPLISQYESRNESFVTPLLNDLSDFFDAIASYSEGEFNGDLEVKKSCFQDAESSLLSAVKSCRLYLIATLTLVVKKFKNRFSTIILMTLDKGKFIGKFNALYQTAKKSKNSDIEKTYNSLIELEKLINEVKIDALVHSLLVENKYVFWGKVVITILISIIVNYIILKAL